MADTFRSRFKNAWNAFMNSNDNYSTSYSIGEASYIRPDRPRMSYRNERSIINSVYNRIALDVSSITFSHVKLDDNGRYLETIDSGLNNCLSLDANADQTGRALMQDIVITMLDKGCVAVVPTDTHDDPTQTESYLIDELRAGYVKTWYPEHVEVELYNEQIGKRQNVILPKSMVAIIQNPFYVIMNDESSTLQRLIRKLNILDVIDEQSGSGKLDLIIQLPYSVRSPVQQKRASDRVSAITEQLAGSKYGIAYADATEKITQLNRPVENNLLSQIEYLTTMLYSQLGISTEVMNGTADEQQMLNYTNRTIEPIASAIVDEMRRKFLTKTARTRGQSIMYFRDPFKLVPVNNIADIADKFTRNEILTGNEVRQIVGMKPVSDPKADQLRNATISANAQQENDVQRPQTNNGSEESPTLNVNTE